MNTEFDINTATLQEACDYAVQKIVEQGRRCVTNEKHGLCMYSDGKGGHCAVGWLLTECDPAFMEVSGGVNDLILLDINLFRKEGLPSVVREHHRVFDLLQHFHDAGGEEDRNLVLGNLANHINIAKPWYSQWVSMGC